MGPDGRRTVFTDNAGTFSTLAPDQPQLSQVNQNGAAWLLRLPSGSFQLFDSGGNLLQEVFRDGKSLSYAASASTLTVTENPGGAQLIYSRSSSTVAPPGVYDTVTLPDGSQIQYTIDASGMV